MAKRTGPTNPYHKQLIDLLNRKSIETQAPIWRTVADKLNKSRRAKVEVNLSDIERHAANGDVVVIPGIVLGSGDLSKSVNVAAWKFSTSAREKIKKAKGKVWTIEELAKENPKGTGIKILM